MLGQEKADLVSTKPSRVELMARPSIRRLQNVWNDGSNALPATHRDKIKSFLEEGQFTSPRHTEEYFQRSRMTGNRAAVRRATYAQATTSQESLSRSQWLNNFSTQVARRLCVWVAEKRDEASLEGDSKTAATEELADVILARVANILGERKPKRSDPSRLARFMVVVSDRIAVWIDGVVKENLDVHVKQSQGFKTKATALKNI